MDGESKDTPARGASPRPYGIFDEAIAKATLKPRTLIMFGGDGEGALIEDLVTAYRDRAAHRALLRRALHEIRVTHAAVASERTPKMDLFAFEAQLEEMPIIKDLRAALAGADR